MRIPIPYFVALLIVGSLCQCQSVRNSSTAGTPNSPQLFVQAMADDVKQSEPWKKRPPSNANPAEPEVIQRWLHTLEFNEHADNPKDLLIRGRNGDSVALAKLAFYVREYNPRWGYRFEVERTQALRRGVSGVARYYGNAKAERRCLKDRKLIEEAVRQMEREAEKGSLVRSVALYQFCGSLNQTGEELPWGDNEALSAKWLEQVYKSCRRSEFDAIVSTEVARMGLGQKQFRTGKYYPHTPPGWRPGNTTP